MATVALWHLGATGILAGALSLVVLVQSLGDAVHRLRRRTRHAAPVQVQLRPAVEPRTLRTSVRVSSDRPAAMATASGAH